MLQEQETHFLIYSKDGGSNVILVTVFISSILQPSYWMLIIQKLVLAVWFTFSDILVFDGC